MNFMSTLFSLRIGVIVNYNDYNQGHHQWNLSNFLSFDIELKEKWALCRSDFFLNKTNVLLRGFIFQFRGQISKKVTGHFEELFEVS